MIPTEPIGSLPRPPALIAAAERPNGNDPTLDPLYIALAGEADRAHVLAIIRDRARVLGTALAAEVLGAK